MRLFFLYISYFICFTTMWSITTLFASTFEIINPCEDKIYLKETIQIESKISVGSLSIDLFNKWEIPYKGNKHNILSILNTPTEFDSYEIISDRSMRIYGWCYQVNNQLSNKLANDYILEPSQNYSIRWYYGFAHYLNGTWISFCEPLFNYPKQFFCGR
ncbi:MAG: hypothetical protein HQK49_20735 [Oligoflexia bacterium]|nr:hypothetical protein [Oligoflexia bacterium]